MSCEELREAVRAGGLLARDRPRRRDALRRARLGLPARRRGRAAAAPRAVRALHVNYGLREQADGGRAPLRGAVRASSASSSSRRVPARRGAATQRAPGNLQAWARELRYAAARARWPSAARRADRDRAHRQRPGRDDPLPPGGLARAARAAGDGAPREGAADPPAARRHARADGRLLRRARGLRWREDESNDDERFARARVRSGLRAGAARGAPGGRGQRAAHRRAAARGDRAARRARRPPSWRARERSRSRAWRAAGGARAPGRRAPRRGGGRRPTCRRPASASRRSSRSGAAAGAPSCTSAGSARRGDRATAC